MARKTNRVKENLANNLLLKKVGKEDMEGLLESLVLKAKDDETTDGTTDDDSSNEVKSRQLPEDPFKQMAADEFVPPRFNPAVWAMALEQNTRLARCVRSFSRNTVGLGWSIEPIHPTTEETPEKEKKATHEQTEALRMLFNYPNSEMPLSDIFYLMKTDEEATGNGYIEVVRNNGGRIARLYHAPAVTMRVRQMKDENNKPLVYGFIQIRGNQKRYFKNFGDRRVMNAITGKWHAGKEALPPEQRATEILHFKIYDPISSYYGAPRYVPAAAAIAGNRQASVRNVNFFENDAVPRMAVLVSGGRLTQDSMQQIEDFFRAKAKGVENAHRMLVLQVEPMKVGFQQQQRTMVEMKPLTVGVTEDASFQTYREANDEEVREIFGMAPVFFSTENVNKACLARDVKVPLLDGRTLTMGELCAEFKSGEKFYVYSIGSRGEVTVGVAHDPRMTKKNAEIWEVELDNEQKVRGTPDHLFMLRDGTYRELQALQPGDRLMPLYRAVRSTTWGSQYWYYRRTDSGSRMLSEPVHRMVGRFKSGGKLIKGVNVHHCKRTLNNHPDVLELLSAKEHLQKHMIDPARKAAVMAAFREAREDGGVEEKRRSGISSSNKERYALMTSEERENAVAAAIQAHSKTFSFDDVVREAKTCSSWKELAVKLGCDVETVVSRIEKSGLTRREFRAKFMLPRKPARTKRAISVADLERVADSCSTMGELEKATGYSSTLICRILRDAGLAYSSWRSTAMRSVRRSAWNRADDESTWGKFVEAASVSKTREDLEEKTGLSRIVLRRLLRNRGSSYGDFKSQFMGTAVGSGTNHRVVSIKFVGHEDVYDITVDEHHNFALACGIFVHNSSQVSREITNEQEFEPDRLAKEHMINQTVVYEILSELLGNNPMTPDDQDEMEDYRKQIRVRFRFARLTITDPLDQARMDQIYATLGAMTPNELRERIGKSAYPKDYYFADKPLTVALAELTAGLALAISQQEEQKFPAPPQAPGSPEGMPLPEGIEPSLPPVPPERPEEPPEPSSGNQAGAKSKRKISSDKSWQLAVELMGDVRRLAAAGASIGHGGQDGLQP